MGIALVISFGVIGMLRVERMPEINPADVADAWLRLQGLGIRTHRRVIEWLDPDIAQASRNHRCRRLHEEGARNEAERKLREHPVAH